MNHVKAPVIKFVMIAVVLLIILTGIFDVEFEKTLLISLALTVAADALGDLMIFRKTGKGRIAMVQLITMPIITTIVKNTKNARWWQQSLTSYYRSW